METYEYMTQWYKLNFNYDLGKNTRNHRITRTRKLDSLICRHDLKLIPLHIKRCKIIIGTLNINNFSILIWHISTILYWYNYVFVNPSHQWGPPLPLSGAGWNKMAALFQTNVLIEQKSLHYYTVFSQCFNEVSIWWRLVINALIIG